MENKIKEVLKGNGLTDEQIKQIAPKLFLLFSVNTHLLNETIENINVLMWESYMIKGRSFDRNEGKKIMQLLERINTELDPKRSFEKAGVIVGENSTPVCNINH